MLRISLVCALVLVLSCNFPYTSAPIPTKLSASPTPEIKYTQSETPTRAAKQPIVHTFSPSVGKVELSNREPLPKGVEREISTSLGAGCIDERPDQCWQIDLYDLLEKNPSKNIRWIYKPNYPFPFTTLPFVACGYTARQPPNATLMVPSGTKRTLSIEDVGDGDCYLATIPSSLGMELGEYTLILNHPTHELQQRVVIDYPKEPMILGTSKGMLIMGFKPKLSLRLRFYVDEGDVAIYIAERSVTTDENGSLIVDMEIARSAPFHGKKILFVTDGPPVRYTPGFDMRWKPWDEQK